MSGAILHEVGRWPEALQFDIDAAEKGWKSGNLRFWCATQIDQAAFLKRAQNASG